MPVNHSSSIDKLLDYMPDLIEKTNNMMNKIVNNKKEKTEKILKEMQKRNNNVNNQPAEKESKEQVTKQEDIDFEYEYDDIQEDD